MSEQGTNSVVTLPCVKEREEQDKIATNRTVDEVIKLAKVENYMSNPPRPTGMLMISIEELEKLRR